MKYNIFGGVLLALLGLAQFTGWEPTDTEVVPNVPRTVRDNPGVYRSHYHAFYVRTGGK